ncbi:MAG: Fic family protein [Spirochaetaceae bacterium]|jgi:Fic family protein|nr:Fic family protein [Spirochaetaceae bacterium]
MNNIPELYKEWLALQPLTEKKERDINQQFLVDFNYNSNHLEGNTLTYGQTKLLLLFGDTMGNAKMQDYEEMKAHNVGLEWMKSIAKDKEKMLSEIFIRELNKIILVRDFYKTSRDGDYRYQIKVGTYKTRPNSVITSTGELFDYASPEETAQLMGDLVQWYRTEERKGELKAEELAAMFHYRYIRIHPFEDGNGRIARLLVNYILLRYNYPMIVIRTDDRDNYLKVLHQCDQLTGKIPYDGANATLEQTKPLVNYTAAILENKLATLTKFVKGEIPDFIETSDDTVLTSANVSVNVIQNVSVKTNVIELITQKPKITVKEMAQLLSVTERTIYRQLDILKTENRIERIGSDKTGYWKIT